MRRSTFYMGKAFSAKHLNATRSPLITGFVSTIHSTSTRSGISSSVLSSSAIGNFLTGANPTSISTSSIASQDLALQLQVLAAQMQQAWIELCGLHSVVTFILARSCIWLRDGQAAAAASAWCPTKALWCSLRGKQQYR